MPLSDEEKVFVNNYFELYDLEVYFVKKQTADAFDSAVSALDESATAKQIFDLMKQYESYDEDVKLMISEDSVIKLENLYESKKSIIDKAYEVTDEIEALNNLSSKVEIEATRDAYNSLSNEAKELISADVLAKLEAQEQKVVTMETAALAIQNRIDGVTDEDLSDLKVLTSLAEVKAEITSIDTLIDSFVELYGQANLEVSVNNLSRVEVLNRYLNTFCAYGSESGNGFSQEGCDVGANYSYPINIGTDVDETYGEVFTCNLNEGNKHIEMRVANDAVLNDFTNVDYYFFYFYNPTPNAFGISLSAASNWGGKIFEKTVNPGWNKIEIGVLNATRLRFLCTTLSTKTSVATVEGTWKMTKMYGSCGVADAYTLTKPVTEAINALTNDSTESDVVAIRTAYEALDIEHKAFITNLETLEYHEERIKLSKLVERADVIVSLIDQLPATASSEEGIMAVLSQMGSLAEMVDEFIGDYGMEVCREYITNYDKYETIHNATAGYQLVYGNGATDGFSQEGCDVGANYSYPINMNTEIDSTYGKVFTCELNPGNGFVEMKIANDAITNNFDVFASYFFYFYNPTESAFSMALSAGSNWGGEVFRTTVNPGWNKIVIDSSKAAIMRFINTTMSSVKLADVSGTWKMTTFIGVKKAA